MSDDRQLQQTVYIGDVLTPVGILGVSTLAQPESVAEFRAALKNAKQSFARLKIAMRLVVSPDEHNVIDYPTARPSDRAG